MALARHFLSRRLRVFLKPQNPSCLYHIIHSNTLHPHEIPPFHHRTFASSPQTQDLTNSESERKENKKPLYFLFKGPVGLLEKTDNRKGKDDPEIRKLKGKSKQGEASSLSEYEKMQIESKKLKRKSRKVWRLKAKSKEEKHEEVDKGENPKTAEPKRLYDLFSNQVNSKGKQMKARPRELRHKIAPVEMHKEVKQSKQLVLKELSPDMEILVHYLYKEGYFNDANFAKGNRFDISWFDDEYARNYILFAVQKFGKDKQEISKWLSGSDLKQVAMFGCPSVCKAQVFPSKRLRSYFKIPENTVCSKCILQDSCKFANQSVWKSDTNNLHLAVVMKVICHYAMLSVDPKLVVPDEIQNSVSRLLKEVLKLSETV